MLLRTFDRKTTAGLLPTVSDKTFCNTRLLLLFFVLFVLVQYNDLEFITTRKEEDFRPGGISPLGKSSTRLIKILLSVQVPNIIS